MSFTTWVRVEDASAQFDHPKGRRLPKGAHLVEGYPEYVGNVARPSKPLTDKAGAPRSTDPKSSPGAKTPDTGETNPKTGAVAGKE